MANIKNFGIAGVGSDIQFGKGGARIIQAGNAFQVKKADNSALTNIQVANPVAGSDAATKDYVDAAKSAADTALAAETAARVADVDAEETRAKAAESALQAAIDAEATARVADVNSEEDRATAAEGVLTTNLTAEVTRATAAEGKLTTDLAKEVQDRKDADALLAADIAALGSAFNYVASLEGGIDTDNATDLAAQAQKDAGDYYKVSKAGFFKIGTGTAFYASKNDGLVWNLEGGVDIIDNTNSVVSGTANFVSVTGSTDTGFVVDVDAAFKTRVSTLETDLSSEIADRIAAVAAEASARTTADSTLTTNLAQEVSDRIAADAAEVLARDAAILVEKNRALAAEAALATDLATEVTARQTAVSNEATARSDADIALGGRIDTEVSDRTSADTALGIRIDNEASARSTKDGELQVELDATQAGAGLDTDGSYIVNTGSTYLTEATSLADADNKLDVALKAEVDARVAAGTAASGALAAEVTRATAAETKLTNDLAAEVTRATGAEGTLTTNLAAEITRATAAEADLSDAIAAEVTRATGAEGTLTTNLAAEVTRAEGVESALQAELDATQTGAGLGANGGYSANVSASYISGATSLKDADNLLDAALKAEELRAKAAEQTLTETVNALGSAFNYVGTVAGGSDVAAFDLGTLPATGKNAGDYYKVSVAGYFTYNGSPVFHANQNDGLVFNNADPQGVDIIDNTNSIVRGTDDFVTVTGGTEFGFDVTIADTFKGRVTTLESGLAAEITRAEGAESTLTTNLAAEVTRATAAEGVLTADLASEVTRAKAAESTLTTNLAAEVTRATAAEGVLTDALAAEVTRATDAETAIADDLAQEVLDRAAADTALQTALTAETNRATAAEDVLTTAIATEKTRAEAAELVLTNGLSAEVTRATGAENTLTTNLAAEVTRATTAEGVLTTNLGNEVTRAQAKETALQNELDTTQTGAGLAADGTYVADGSSNYASSATSLADADKKLDTALKALADTVAAGTSDLQDELDATQAGAGLSATGAYVANATGNYISTATTLAGADDLLDAALKAEATARAAADVTLQANIDAEAASRAAADSTLTTNLANEVTRATGAEATLTTNLANEVTRATGAEATLTTAIATEATRAQGVEATLATAIDTEKTRAMTAESALDGKIAALGSAFNYVGTLAGGPVENTDYTDLAGLTQKDAGDYYKVTTSGWFRVNGFSNSFFAKAGDGLVWNLGGSIDIIDNTNSEVFGTTDFIAVSGTTDTGFTIDVAGNFKTRVSTLETGLASEITNRTTADTALQTNIDNEATARGTADTTLQSNITAEATARANADTALQGNIDAEASRATAAEGVLTTNLATEVTNRTDADAALQGELNATQAGAGLGTDGSYTAPSSNYLATATSLANADVLLDTKLKQVADDLANLSQDEIVSQDRKTSVKAADTGVEFSTNVGGTKTKVGEIVAGASTNTTFQVDLGTADEVRIDAAGASADVDIRLSPKGDGQVFIGDIGDGTIQADDGYNLYVAGGDNAAGNGGNLILRGGDGSATDGLVEVRDGASKTVAKFAAGAAGATAYTNILNGTTSVKLAADGSEANIDIVLDPKGTGSVDVADAKVVNVAAPTAAHDAANKEYVDTSLAGGYVKTAVVNLTEATGVVSLGQIKGTVLRVKVYVTSAFSSGASITVGTATSTAELAPSSNVDETAAGLYLIETMNVYGSATEIVAAVTAGSGSAGVAKVVVEYLTA